MNLNQKKQLYSLLNALREEVLTDEQFSELEHLVFSDSEAAQEYVLYVKLWTDLQFFRAANSESNIVPTQDLESLENSEFWQAMANYEKHAPEIKIPQEQSQRELIQKVVYPPRKKRNMSKFNIVFLAMNAAAILFIVLFFKFAPSKPVEVATLSDSLNAKWADNDSSIHEGTRLATNSDALMLREGLVKLSFDDCAKAIIEAPAEFQILAEDRIGLNYGRVYAIVPKEAIGFSVYTPHAKVVDLGTEFGVQVETHGDTQLHVLKGKTMLMAGEKNRGISMEVSKRTAKKISGDTQTVTDIPCKEKYFVRDFDSDNDVVWRQQPSLDLADMVRHGNGMGTGNPAARLDPVKGFTTDWHIGIISASNEYLFVPDHPFIDGIFVPDGETSQIVSSRGDIFEECPDTSGLFDIDLFANPKPETLKTKYREGTIRFNGQEYTDESGNACIIMHANHGLTFDLEAIRKSYHRDIKRFTSRVGIADLKEDCPCNADFYMLVDGQIRYSLRQYKQKGVLNDVFVEIKETDRFLTLVTTDGGDPDHPEGGFYTRAISCDWCVFTEPVLMFE